MTPKRPVYPFAALVGQERLKQALILNAVNPRIGGVLIRGEKGTAKSTAARGLAELLPPIAVVAGCPFHCHPELPGTDVRRLREAPGPGRGPAPPGPAHGGGGPAPGHHRGPAPGHHRPGKGHQERREAFRAGPFGRGQPGNSLRRRSEPVGRPPGGRALGRRGHGGQRGGAGGDFRMSTRPGLSWWAP